MKIFMPVLALVVLIGSFAVFAQSNQTAINANLTITSGDQTIDSPWTENSKICIFVREWVLKGMFLVVFLVFLTGIATISGAAFPQWRDYGSKMILGSLGAMVLYILGMQALRFFMETSICGL
ncbi:MAG: hypothetical protein V1822_00165 [Candidatus Micrarchaeota archaeon]